MIRDPDIDLFAEVQDGAPVLVALSPVEADPDQAQARQAMMQRLAGSTEPWLLRPLRLETRGPLQALVSEPPLGTPLADLLRLTRPDPAEVLRIGIKLVEAVDALHGMGLCHLHLTPRAIFLRPDDDRLQIALYPGSLASRPPLPAPDSRIPLEDLLFRAPEQTGRLARGTDARADIYALGAILHLMVEGRAPFGALDRMEVLHQIIATPAPRAQNAPAALASIIAHALRKAPEDRYQTVWGMGQDLKLALQRLLSGDPSDLRLGAADAKARFAFPPGLFGREADLARLTTLAGPADAGAGEARLVVVGGYSGAGKSSLIADFLARQRAAGAVTLAGKHDLLQTLPYKALIEALRTHVQQMLAASAADRAAWLARLRDRVGAGLDALVAFVPELTLVVGDIAAPDRIDPGEREERFQLAIRGLFESLGTADAPAFLVLDDLQWADLATFKVVEDLVTASDARHLTILGAFRSNEVGETHPLAQLLARLDRGGHAARLMDLAPLTLPAVSQIVQATLSVPPDRALDLARPLMGKTLGNPFHLRQLLAALHESGDLRFDRRLGQWDWQIDRIARRMVDADIAQLLAERIDRLSPDTRETLTLAACFGAEFTAQMLSILDNWPGERRARALAEAEAEGLILRNPASTLAEAWLFSHDRVQQAAYARLQPQEAQALHARIGDWLMRDIADPARDPRLFVALDHVALAIDLLRDPVAGRRLTALTLAAARKARSVAAYDLALRYLAAVEALPPAISGADWASDPATTRALQTELLEARFLVEGWPAAEPHFDMLIARAATRDQKAAVHHLVSSLFTIQVDYPRALHHGIEGARLMGIDLAGPYGPKIGMALSASLIRQPRPDKFDFSALPVMADDRRAQAMDLLVTVATPAFLANTEMFVLLALRMYQLTLRHGLTDSAASAISNYAIVIYIAFGSVDCAYAIQQRLEEMFARRDVPARMRGRVIYSRAMVLDWYKEPHARIQDKLDAGLELSRLAADREYIGYYHFGRLRYLFAQGVPLSRLRPALDQAERVARQLRHDTLAGLCSTYRRLLAHAGAEDLRAPLWSADEDAYEKTLMNEPNQGSFYAAMFLLAVVEEDYPLAETLRRRLEGLANYIRTGPDFGEILLLTVALARSTQGSLPAPIARKVARTGAKAEKRLRALVTAYPTNTRHLGAVLDALSAERREGAAGAGAAWDAAIRACEAAGQGQYAALAADLAARGAARAGLEAEAQRRLAQAMPLYDAWGATRRARQIAARLPALPEPAVPRGLSVDAGAIVKAAHAIFESLDPAELMQRLLGLALKNAGADRGALYLMDDGKPQLVSEARIDAGRLAFTHSPVPRPLPDLDPSAYPVSIVGAVAQQGRIVLIDDADRPGEFSASLYLAQRRSRSLLCLPVIRSGRVEAILHVENSLSPHVFTPDRREVLETLVGLAAISLVNARLYARQEQALRMERQAGEELERLSRLKDEFLANTSHELRTPLNGIIGLAESLADGAKGPLPAPAVQTLNLVVASGRRLEHLVSDILDVSRLRAGGVVLRTAPVDLWTVTDLTLSLLAPRAQATGTPLVNAVPRNLAVLADEDRLQQILLNLLDNALKFAPGAPVTVVAQPMGDRVRIAVQDQGPGVPLADRARIFQAFEQLDASTVRAQQGAGLGLSIAQHLVQLHGSAVTVSDAAPHGAVFAFDLAATSDRPAAAAAPNRPRLLPPDLPKADLPTETSATASAETPAVTPAARAFRVDPVDDRGLVLIVDDDPINRQVLEDHLGLAGYRTHAAADGPAALAALEQGLDPQVVLLDLMMPRMSGYDVCARIRQTRPAARLPVIMLTAKNRADDLAHAFEAGASDYIAKPFVKEELLARVRSHAELSRLNRAYERFVPVEFLKFLKRDRIIDLELGDSARQDMTVMFTDIRRFSTLTEQLSPAEGFELLVDYFAAITPAIYDHGGFLNLYTGDGVMALFPGAPDAALSSALAVQQAVDRFNQTRLARNRPRIQTGIGLHRGPVTLGILGHDDRRTANVVSDAVNLAARIENLTGFYGIRIALSRDLVDGLADPSAFAVRDLDRLRVQGREQPVTVVELFGSDDPDLVRAKSASLPAFRAAMEDFRAGRFQAAADGFAAIHAAAPGDGPAARLEERARDYARGGPPADWLDGIRMSKITG